MKCNAKIISVVGCDNNGRFLMEMLESKNNDNIIIADSSRYTTTKHRFYVNKKLVFRYDIEDTFDISEEITNQIVDEFKKRVSECKILVLSDYNKGVLTTNLTSELIRIANNNNVKVFVDPKFKNLAKYTGCFLIKPNQIEGENICKHKITTSNAEMCSQK